METPPRDGARVRFPPPLLYLVGILAGLALQRYGYRLQLPLRGVPQQLTAGLAGLLGLAIIVAALARFRRTGQDPKPWKPTPEIIGGGVYRLSRNPMYLGMTLLQLAVAVALANLWILLLTPVVMLAVFRVAIRPEEAYLERKFGEGYLAYKRSVRRWL